MADGNLTEEQLAVLSEALRELKKSLVLSEKTQASLQAAMNKDTEAFKDNAESVSFNTSIAKNFYNDMSGFGGEIANAVSQLRENRENFTSLNPAIRAAGQLFAASGKAAGSLTESAGDAVQGMAGLSKGFKGFAATMIGGGLLKGVGGALKHGSEAASQLAVAFGEFATGELQNVVESYRKVGSAGIIGAGGVNEMYESAVKLGIGLSGFADTVSRNSKSLAYAGGSTKAGANALVGMVENSKQYEDKLLALGFTFTEMRDDSAKFLERNRVLGSADMNDKKRLAEANNNYMMQLDRLARITGKSRDEVAKQLEQQMKNVRFQATMRMVTKELGAKQAEAISDTAEMLGSYADKEFEKGFMDAVGGAINTPEGTAFWNAIGEEGKQAVRDLRSGAIKDASTAMQIIAKSTKNLAEARGGDEYLGQIGKTNSALESVIPGIMRLSQMTDEQIANMKKVNKEQTDASNAQDDETKRMISAQKKLQQMGQKLDDITRKEILPHAAAAVETFTSSINDFVDVAAKALGTKRKPKAQTLTEEGAATSGASTGGTAGTAGAAEPTGGATPSAPVTGTTQQVLETIKSRESGGNYAAQAKGSTASGAYQFIDSTWQSLTKKYGIGAEFAKAKDAPQQIQDAVAAKYVDDILKKAGGDVSKVPLAWYTGNIQGKMSDAALAANQGQTAQAYQQKWMASYSKTTGASTTSTTGAATSPRDQAYQQEVAKLDSQEARLAAAKERMWEARKRMAYKNPNGQVIVQSPGEPWAANGGVFSGPRSGYSATLHGNEAVVPLPSGNQIPVDMGNMADSFEEQISLLGEQTASLEELLRTLKQGTELSQRILRASQA